MALRGQVILPAKQLLNPRIGTRKQPLYNR
jgi:hypothetical protein